MTSATRIILFAAFVGGVGTILTIAGCINNGDESIGTEQMANSEISRADEVSDRQLQSFATAVTAVESVSQSYAGRLKNAENSMRASAIEKEARTKMEGAIEQVGLSVDEYKRIATLLETDAALRKRFEGVMEAKQ